MAAQTQQLTESLAARLEAQPGDLSPVYGHLDSVLADWQAAGANPEDFLPVTAEPGLGFSLRRVRNGKTFWEVLIATTRDSLCAADSELRQRMAGTAGKTSAATVVTAVMATLGLPAVAGPIAAAIAAFVLCNGLDALCTWTEPTAGESATT